MTHLVFGLAAAGVLAAAYSSTQSSRPAPQLPADVRATPGQVDLWIARDGTIKQGALQGCSNVSCTIDGVTVPRADLLWIGVGVRPDTMPDGMPVDVLNDAVQLTGSTFQNAPLLGISATSVTTGRGAFPRGGVDWIYLAPVIADQDQPSTIYKPTPPAAGDASAPGAPPAPPAPPDAPPPFVPPSNSPGKPGASWQGSIIARFTSDLPGSSITTQTVSAQLSGREQIHPVIVSGATVVEKVIIQPDQISISGTFDSRSLVPGGDSCSGSGRGAGNLEAGFGWLERKTANVDVTPYLGYDLAVGGATYQLHLYPALTATFSSSCNDGQRSWTRDEGFLGLNIGRAHNNPVGGALNDPEIRYVTKDRMAGSYQTSENGLRSAVSWSFCRVGTNCPPPQPLPEESTSDKTDPCPPPTVQKAQLDLALQQQLAMFKAFAQRRDDFFALARKAEQWENDYDQAARDCGLTTLAKALTGFLISNPGVNVANLPTTGGTTPKVAADALAQFYNFLGFLETVESGSASWLLPDQSFNDFAKLPNKYGGFVDPESIYTGVNGFLNFLQGQVGKNSAESLLSSLRSCGGFTVEPVMDGAITYLRLLQEIEPIVRNLQNWSNDLRVKDNEIFNLWEKYKAACLAHQKCSKQPVVCPQ